MHAATIYDAGGDDKLMFFFTGLRNVITLKILRATQVSIETTIHFPSLL